MMLHTKLHIVQSLYTYYFDKVDGYIRIYDKTKYLGLFHLDERNERIFDRT